MLYNEFKVSLKGVCGHKMQALSQSFLARDMSTLMHVHAPIRTSGSSSSSLPYIIQNHVPLAQGRHPSALFSRAHSPEDKSPYPQQSLSSSQWLIRRHFCIDKRKRCNDILTHNILEKQIMIPSYTGRSNVNVQLKIMVILCNGPIVGC